MTHIRILDCLDNRISNALMLQFTRALREYLSNAEDYPQEIPHGDKLEEQLQIEADEHRHTRSPRTAGTRASDD